MAGSGARDAWVGQPDTSDEAVRAATGKGWEEWCAVLDAFPGRTEGHTAIAAWLQHELGVDGWWAQSVTVGYERIRGMRLPHQMPDGTFQIGVSRTLAVDAARLRERLLDPEERQRLFPRHETDLRSRATSKNVRLAIGGGTAEISMTPKARGKVAVVVTHAKLRDPASLEGWKGFWADWLASLA